MKNLHRKAECLNCHQPLQAGENFCPVCGQQNTDYKYPVWELLKEVVENYISLDSRLFRSLPVFLFQPGRLSVEFSAGRRRRYVHPVRFYLIVSLLFFFSFTQVLQPGEGKDGFIKIEIDDKLKDVGIARERTMSGIDTALQRAVATGAMNERQALELNKLFANVDKTWLLRQHLDTVKSVRTLDLMGDNYKFNEDKLLYLWIRDPAMTPDALLDSANTTSKNWFNYRLARQMLKMGRQTPAVFLNSILENIPLMIFLLIPVFALIVKIVHIRSSKLYLEHLVFTFHLHTFLFLVMTLAICFSLPFMAVREEILAWGYGLFLIYTLLAFKRMYKQGWFKTFFKLMIIFTLYFFILPFFVLGEVLLSFLFT